MRPSKNPSGANVCECPKCGVRVEDPDSRICGECGTMMRSLSKSRDL